MVNYLICKIIQKNNVKKQFVKYLAAHGEDIFSAAWSPNGKHIVTGSMDKTIKINEVKTGLCLQTLVGHLDPVRSVAYSLNGKHIASTSDCGVIKIWGVE